MASRAQLQRQGDGIDRRAFLAGGLGTAGAALSDLRSSAGANHESGKLPVAAAVTVYTTNSHADVIVGKILEGYDQDGGTGPALELTGLYVDQFPKADMSRRLAEKYGFRIARTIEEAIAPAGRIAVRGVLCIGEHGDYPRTSDTRQHMYPRRRFFDEVVAVFRKYGRVVPVFNDKHLGYKTEDALHMVRTARELGIPFLAGSSLPVAWRVPPLVLPRACRIDAALAIGYGDLEAYGFHALETLQCMVERRAGGETGVAAVQAVRGEEIWRAERAGRWSRPLLDAALKAQGADVARLEKRLNDQAAFFLVEYRDGLMATVAMINGASDEFGFAARLHGTAEPSAAWFQLQDGKPFRHFGFLIDAIAHTIRTGRPAYPVERTLLTTGVLDAAMHSLTEGGRRIETPALDIRYQPADWPFAQGTAPKGKR